MKNRNILAFVLLNLLCITNTGCIRMAADISMRVVSCLGPHPEPSIMVTDRYFDGTLHVAPLLFTPLLPIVIVDLPLEFAWDLLLIPKQILNKIEHQRYLDSLSLTSLLESGYLEEVSRRLRSPGEHFDGEILVGSYLNWKNDEAKKRLLPVIYALFKADKRYGEMMLSGQYMQHPKNLELYRYLFNEKLLIPAEYPDEHAVYNVMLVNLDAAKNLYEARNELLRLMLENGCNPNGYPRPDTTSDFCKPEYTGKTALDEALRQMQLCSGAEKAVAEKAVELLKVYGAKTGSELRLYPDLFKATLTDFFFHEDEERFAERLRTASQVEKDAALTTLFTLGSSEIIRDEPVCSMHCFKLRKAFLDMLLKGGAQPPDDILCRPEYLMPDNLELYVSLFDFCLNVSTASLEHAVLSYCYNLTGRWYIRRDLYDKKYVDFLKMLLEHGCDPNKVWEQCSHIRLFGKDKTALDLMNRWCHFNRSTMPDRERMMNEIRALLIDHGAKAYSELKQMEKTGGNLSPGP